MAILYNMMEFNNFGCRVLLNMMSEQESKQGRMLLGAIKKIIQDALIGLYQYKS
jgi:hypothetical protein